LPKYLVTVTGEIPLRSSRTRPRFYKVLIDNIRDAVERVGGRVNTIEILEAKILLDVDREVEEVLTRVFGVYRVGRVLEYEFRDLKDLAEWVASKATGYVQGKKFAVRVKRSGQHDFTSLDVAREVGALLKPFSKGVDLENPEVEVSLEVRGSRVFLYLDTARGPGGLPIGVEGRGLVLFSGGFDSPVAAWFTAKRGVRVDFLHYVMGSTQSSYNAFRVAQELARKWLYGYRPVFIIVDFRDLLYEITKKVEWSYRQVVLRALMYIVGSKIAVNQGYDVIVTGESIGQASSQTLRNLEAIELVSKPLKPIMRPLVGFDKEEIIEYSRRIGLYELSSMVVEACSIAPSRVVTAAKPDELTRELEKINMELVEKAVREAKTLDLLSSNPLDVIPSSDLEIDFIPVEAIVVDARNPENRVKNPIHGAIGLEELKIEELPREKPVIIVCETGVKSLLIARTLREHGLKAYSFKGGYCRR